MSTDMRLQEKGNFALIRFFHFLHRK